MKLLQPFIKLAFERSNEIFLKDDSYELTYSEVLINIQNLRSILQEKKIKNDSKILILSSNDNSFFIALIATLLEGGIAVPISTESSDSEINTIIIESQTDVIIGPSNFIDRDILEKSIFPKDFFIPREAFMQGNIRGYSLHDFQISSFEGDESEIRLILFTSGSEGIPKGVCLSDRSLFHTINQCTYDFWNIKQTDNVLMIAPSQTIFGITISLVSAISGSKLRLVNNFNPQSFINTIIEDKITFFAGVPTLAELMLKLKDRIPKSNLFLKKILIAGAPLPEITEKNIESEFNIKIITGYGMTEGVPMAFRNEFEINYPSRTVGRISSGCELKIIDENNKQTTINTEGEIIVKGLQLFSGYISKGKTDNSCFENGWFRTGDIGYIDVQGFLFISGRKSDLIKRSGFRVFPAEIENIIMKIEGVSNCAVIGITDKTRGEKIIAFVSGNEIINEKGILTELKQSLSTHKIPNEIIFLNEMPKTIAGKTDKLILKEKYLSS